MTTPQETPRVVYLRGNKTILRPICREDTDKMFEFVNDREIMKYMGSSLPMPYQAEVGWVESQLKRDENNIVLAVETKDGDFLGTMGLHRIDRQNGTASTGALFGNAKLLGKGYGTDAKIAMLLWAFNEFPIHKVCSSVFSSNKRSYKYLQKTGYKREGILRKQRFIDGEHHDEYLMAVFRNEFLKQFGGYLEKPKAKNK